MKITLKIAKILNRLAHGKQLPASSAKQKVILQLIDAGIIHRSGRVRQKIWVSDVKALQMYLHNKFSIKDLDHYIASLQKDELSRSAQTQISADSKLRKTRTFKGFLVNSYLPIKAQLRQQEIIVNPLPGTFQFIYDFEDFLPPEQTTIIGIENAENFRYVEKQHYLFQDLQPLFVSRYPQAQSKDLINWLQKIPNPYLHFGDFDFAGINIYCHEFKNHLGNKAQFFVPENIEEKIRQYGNRSLYNRQKLNVDLNQIDEKKLIHLIKLIHHFKKGLEQEVLIIGSH